MTTENEQRRFVGHREVLSHCTVDELRAKVLLLPDNVKLAITEDTAWSDPCVGPKFVAEWETIETDDECRRRLEHERQLAMEDALDEMEPLLLTILTKLGPDTLMHKLQEIATNTEAAK